MGWQPSVSLATEMPISSVCQSAFHPSRFTSAGSTGSPVLLQHLQTVYGCPPHLVPETPQGLRSNKAVASYEIPELRAWVSFYNLPIQGGEVSLMAVSPRLSDAGEAVGSVGKTVLFLNKCGAQTVLPASVIRQIPSVHFATFTGQDACSATMRSPGWRADYWGVKTALQQGLSVVTLHESTLAPDHPQAFFARRDRQSASVLRHPHFLPGVIATWASGLELTIHFLRTHPDFQDQKIGLLGHSRRGKAALLATAMCPEVDFVIPHQTGTLGMVSVQDGPLESLRQITSTFPHWFTPALGAVKSPQDLCCDQSQLIQHIAPRPVGVTEGYFDPWASYWLSLKTLQRTQSAYAQVYAARQLPMRPLHTYTFREDSDVLKAPLLHVTLWHPHTMHGDYWRVIGSFLHAQWVSDL